MTEVDELLKQFEFPFTLHDYQKAGVFESGMRDCVLLRHKIGYGKSAIGLGAALFYSVYDDVEQILIVVPPVLINQWVEFVSQVKGIPSVLVFRGNPRERQAMNLLTPAVVIVSTNIFRSKESHKRFIEMGEHSKLAIIYDELSLKEMFYTTS